MGAGGDATSPGEWSRTRAQQGGEEQQQLKGFLESYSVFPKSCQDFALNYRFSLIPDPILCPSVWRRAFICDPTLLACPTPTYAVSCTQILCFYLLWDCWDWLPPSVLLWLITLYILTTTFPPGCQLSGCALWMPLTTCSLDWVRGLWLNCILMS